MKEPDMTFAEKDLAGLLQSLQTQPAGMKTESSSGSDLVIVITGRSLGRGSEHLGGILMKFFLQSLAASAAKPRVILLMSDAVFLAEEGSEVLGSLSVLQEQGTRILLEGTSVDYHQIEEKIHCGQPVSMIAVCGEIMNAARVLVF